MQLISLQVQVDIEVESRLLAQLQAEIDVRRLELKFHVETRKGRANLFEETDDGGPINLRFHTPYERRKPRVLLSEGLSRF